MNRVGIILLLSSATALFAQSPDTLWTKIYGGVNTDKGRSIQNTNDGGYIIAGETRSFGAGPSDIWLIKTDSNGDTLWTKTFGGSSYDEAFSVQQTSDKGYIIVGQTSSYGAGLFDVFLVKTDSLGNTLWTKTYGSSNWDCGWSVQQTRDDGYIISGWNGFSGTADVWLLKTDRLGDTIWTKTYGGAGSDAGYSVKETQDNGFVIVGTTTSFGQGESDLWFIKTDSVGNIIWSKTFGGTDYDYGESVCQTREGGYIIAGATQSYSRLGNYDFWLIKTDSLGDTLWTRIYEGDTTDISKQVLQTQDGGYIVIGYTYSFGAGGSDLYVIRTDINGDTLWTKTFGGVSYDEGLSIQQTQDGGYIVVGQTSSYGSGDYDIWLIRLEAETGITEQNQNTSRAFLFSQNYPNPFDKSTVFKYYLTHSAHINITIYNSLGQKIVTLVNRNESTGFHRVIWDGHDHQSKKLAGGVYFYSIKVGDKTVVRRMCLVR